MESVSGEERTGSRRAYNSQIWHGEKGTDADFYRVEDRRVARRFAAFCAGKPGSLKRHFTEFVCWMLIKSPSERRERQVDRHRHRQLVRVFGLMQAVPLLGDRVPIGDKHRARFPVFALDDWPSSGV